MIKKPPYEELAQRIAALEMEVAKHKQLEEALQENEVRYRGIFEYTKNGVAVYEAVNDGEDFIFLDFNQAGEKIDNIKREKLIGRSVLEIFRGIRDLGLFEVFQRVWRTGQPEHHPTNIYRDERLVGWRDNFVYKLPSGEIVAIYSDETERKQAQNRLRESEARFRALTESAPSAIFIFHAERFLYVNPAFEAIAGFSKAEILQMRFWDLIHPDMRELVRKRGLARQRGEDVPARYEVKILTKDGKTKWMDVAVTLIDYKNKSATLGMAYDNTERKQAQDLLIERERQLEHQSRNLAEVNTALKVLLKSMEDDRIDFKEKMLSNVKRLVLPYLEKLKTGNLTPQKRVYLETIENNLKNIISPFTQNLSSKHYDLTPTEIQVAALIKEGKTTKDVANMLNKSPHAINFHRNNIRRKIGLQNKKTNLRSYLLSFE
jgi:PAS domain S-box-containing protein